MYVQMKKMYFFYTPSLIFVDFVIIAFDHILLTNLILNLH